MGARAYRRGSECHARQLEAEYAPEWVSHNCEVMDRINRLPRGSTRPFCGGVLRPQGGAYGIGGGIWWILDNQREGWGAFGYRYRSLKALMADWSIKIVGIGRDECSFFYRFEPV